MGEFYGDQQVYSESGVDLTLLRENLRRPFEQRVRQNAHMAQFAAVLQASASTKVHDGMDMENFDAPAILRQLEQHGVEYVLIGGLAMIAHGSAYVTKDLDICYARTAASIEALVNALHPLHPYLRGVPPGVPFRLDAATIQAGMNFTLITDLGDMDLLGDVSGVGDYQKVLARSEPRNLYDLTIQVLSLDGLIAAKKAAGRTKDKLHLLELAELKKMKETPDAGPSTRGNP